MKKVLNIGAGKSSCKNKYPLFVDWEETTFDIDERYKPDIVADVRDLTHLRFKDWDEYFDAIWVSHILEHLYSHEVMGILENFKKILKKDGFVVISLPDVGMIASHIINKGLETPLYESPAGEICAIDMLWGHRPSIIKSKAMAHKTGFTVKTLTKKLEQAEFKKIETSGDEFEFQTIAYK